MAYLQKLYRNRTVHDAIRRALLDHPKASYVEAELQRNLFHDHEDVFVTLEISDE